MRFPVAVALLACAAIGSSASIPWPHPADVATSSAVKGPLPLIASHFQDHMVLQRGGNGPIVWGFAEAGTTVSVTFAQQETAAVADATGTWRAQLPPLPAGGPYDLVVTATTGTLRLQDILMGDVYIVSGQSNAQFTVASAFNATEEIAAAANYPNIRVFTVGQGTTSTVALPNLNTIEQNWAVASPQSIGVGNWTAFSAVAWFFARDLYDGLGGTVPLGIISDNWGGTPIQYWMSPEALLTCGMKNESTLWNAMIHPLLVGPLAATGVVWYQGEQNAGPVVPTFYECALPALINDWRSGFQNPNLWFAGVQLAPWIGSGVPIAVEREAQESLFQLPLTALATAIDLGDPKSPFGSVHPRNKQPLGTRLAANALAQVYGKNVPHLSPRFLSAIGSTDGPLVTVNVYFYSESVVDGLQLLSNPGCPTDEGVPANICSGFQILLESNNWVDAVPALGASNSIILSAQVNAAGNTPVAVSYAFNAWPVTTLFSLAGFPALPFNGTVSSM